MKVYLLIILLFGACVKDNKQNISDSSLNQTTNEIINHKINTNIQSDIISSTERDLIIAGLEKGDYSVLDPFFETNQLFPDKVLKNGYTVIGDLKNRIITTNKFKFINSGQPISYTNKYGIEFLETKTLIFCKDELDSFSDESFKYIKIKSLIKQASDMKNLGDISNLLVCIDKNIVITIGRSDDLIYNMTTPLFNKLNITDKNLLLNNQQIYNYIYLKIVPQNFENQKNFWINFITYILILNYRENGEFFPDTWD